MKFFSTFFIALFLFGLCLVEKELKRRALEAQGAEEDLVKWLEKNPYSEPAFANLQIQTTGLKNPNFHFQILTALDSASAKFGRSTSFNKPL